mmetsp:Transcript_14090/g.35404  ORF Transcript_14090/g.35404 Transcript_14090/m.35404 type:complete len:236 (-) Transcript_14090:1041-1748(-)
MGLRFEQNPPPLLETRCRQLQLRWIIFPPSLQTQEEVHLRKVLQILFILEAETSMEIRNLWERLTTPQVKSSTGFVEKSMNYFLTIHHTTHIETTKRAMSMTLPISLMTTGAVSTPQETSRSLVRKMMTLLDRWMIDTTSTRKTNHIVATSMKVTRKLIMPVFRKRQVAMTLLAALSKAKRMGKEKESRAQRLLLTTLQKMSTPSDRKEMSTPATYIKIPRIKMITSPPQRNRHL